MLSTITLIWFRKASTWLLNQNPVSDQRLYNKFPSSDQCGITVNRICEEVLLIFFSIMMILKYISISRLECKNHTLFTTKMTEISFNWYPIYDQNSRKTIPFGAAHPGGGGYSHMKQTGMSLTVFRPKRQYFMPPRSRLGFREEAQNYAKRSRSQIFLRFMTMLLKTTFR